MDFSGWDFAAGLIIGIIGASIFFLTDKEDDDDGGD